ncbi:MAG: PQQ-binding-like beta-propeller repeat protein [Gammaproteobacteria bacterium]|nr:PQQ-binding-like beta-propeller repeat protein [Gammaproteobacteria bacterium]
MFAKVGLATLGLLVTLMTSAAAAECDSTPGVDRFARSGWGFGERNLRFQPDTDIDRSNVQKLELAWAFALDGGMSPHSYPLVTEDTVFIGTPAGTLFALERDSGCVRWKRKFRNAIRTAVIHAEIGGEERLVFGTGDGWVITADAITGEQLWETEVRDHPHGIVTGTPLYHEGRVYAPVSSYELAVAMDAMYECCTFRGSLVALDAADGTVRWRTHTIAEAPEVTGRHYVVVKEWGPSGTPIWSAPTIDAATGLLYVGTGENYTAPATATSDAIMALRSEDGEIAWTEQFTANDTFNMACLIPDHPSCPEEVGPDYDFGAPPVLARTPDGEQILLAGQKSGGVYAMKPYSGERLWTLQLGRGGYLGGVHWGMAVNELLGLLYVPISDRPLGPAASDESLPGLHALELQTGAVRWSAINPDRCRGRQGCDPGISAAIVATPDLVFAGSLDGLVSAYDARTGEIAWSYDTWRKFDGVNGETAGGGSIDVHGPMVAGDMLLIQSGYGQHGQAGGNALLAFRLPSSTADAQRVSPE